MNKEPIYLNFKLKEHIRYNYSWEMLEDYRDIGSYYTSEVLDFIFISFIDIKSIDTLILFKEMLNHKNITEITKKN